MESRFFKPLREIIEQFGEVRDLLIEDTKHKTSNCKYYKYKLSSKIKLKGKQDVRKSEFHCINKTFFIYLVFCGVVESRCLVVLS